MQFGPSSLVVTKEVMLGTTKVGAETVEELAEAIETMERKVLDRRDGVSRIGSDTKFEY
jgi:hypothetical protein